MVTCVWRQCKARQSGGSWVLRIAQPRQITSLTPLGCSVRSTDADRDQGHNLRKRYIFMDAVSTGSHCAAHLSRAAADIDIVQMQYHFHKHSLTRAPTCFPDTNTCPFTLPIDSHSCCNGMGWPRWSSPPSSLRARYRSPICLLTRICIRQLTQVNTGENQ